jgi:hypothetical protein
MKKKKDEEYGAFGFQENFLLCGRFCRRKCIRRRHDTDVGDIGKPQ